MDTDRSDNLTRRLLYLGGSRMSLRVTAVLALPGLHAVGSPAAGRSRFGWRPGALLVATMVTLLVASPALTALRVGTRNAETLTGTSGNDHLTGAEGNDLLKGLAGNDTYFFADNWGSDTLVEKPGEGTDTLNFRGVKNGVSVYNIREWHEKIPDYPYVRGPGADGIAVNSAAGVAIIEKVIGGQGADDGITSSGGPNTFMPGGGATDLLQDYGGWNDGPAGKPEIPGSNDTYKGFADNTGTDFIFDWSGTDVVDLRPLSTEDVYLSRLDFDGNGTEESLQIVTGPTAQVILGGHFGPYSTYTSAFGQQGRIEKLIFADATFTNSAGLSSVMAASVEATSGKPAELADAADRLAEEARKLLAEQPEPGSLADRGSGGRDVGPEPGGEPAKHHKADKKHKHATKATHEKKHATKGTRATKGTNATRPRAQRP